MYRRLAPWTTLCLITLLGCSDDQVLCPPLPNWAVAVDVRDSVTGALLASGASGAVFLAGILDDSLRRDHLIHLSSDTLLVGGVTEGRVEVRIAHLGYLPWVDPDVQTHLSEGRCPDWETQQLMARLQVAPE
jgi:hypothetical protein